MVNAACENAPTLTPDPQGSSAFVKFFTSPLLTPDFTGEFGAIPDGALETDGLVSTSVFAALMLTANGVPSY